MRVLIFLLSTALLAGDVYGTCGTVNSTITQDIGTLTQAASTMQTNYGTKRGVLASNQTADAAKFTEAEKKEVMDKYEEIYTKADGYINTAKADPAVDDPSLPLDSLFMNMKTAPMGIYDIVVLRACLVDLIQLSDGRTEELQVLVQICILIRVIWMLIDVDMVHITSVEFTDAKSFGKQ